MVWQLAIYFEWTDDDAYSTEQDIDNAFSLIVKRALIAINLHDTHLAEAQQGENQSMVLDFSMGKLLESGASDSEFQL